MTRRKQTTFIPVLLLMFIVVAGAGKSEPGDSPVSMTPRQLLRNIHKKSFTGEVMDFDFDGIAASKIFRHFEEISGLTFQIDADLMVARKLAFLGVEWDRALYLVLRNLDLDLKLEGDGLHVVKGRPGSQGPSLAFVAGVLTAAVFILLGFLVFRAHRKKNKIRQLQKKVSLPEARIDEISKKLIYLFEVEKIYREETLSLNVLAHRLNIPSHHLSWILNARIGKTFFDFLNFHRIEEVKNRLRDPDERHRTILDIAYSAGFSSKSAFNKTFKTVTGKTPSDFRSDSIR